MIHYLELDVEAIITGQGDETGFPLDDHNVLLGVTTVPPTLEKGVAMLAIANNQATSEGSKEQRHNDGHSCQELPILMPIQADFPGVMFMSPGLGN